MPGKKEISVTFPWPYRTHPTPSPRPTGHPSPHQSRLPLVLQLCSSQCSGHQYLPIAVKLTLSAARACPMHGTLHGRPAAPRAATKRTTLMRTTRMRMNAFLQRWLAAAAAAPRRKPGCCSSQGAPLPAVSATLTPMQGCGKCGQAWAVLPLGTALLGVNLPVRPASPPPFACPTPPPGWAGEAGAAQLPHFNQLKPDQMLLITLLSVNHHCSAACGQRCGPGHGRHVLAGQLHDAGMLESVAGAHCLCV